MSRIRLIKIAAALLSTLALVCDGDSTGPDEERAIFVVRAVDETFRIGLGDPARIEQARRILRGEESQKIVSGRLTSGDGGFNAPWHWHLLPDSTGFVEAAIELCDGKPSFVEAELDYWLNTVRFYCPWSSQIIAEEPAR